MAKHAAPTHEYDVFDATSGPDRLEVEEIADALRHLPLDADELGDGSASDWTLSILLALAGRGAPDALDYMAPRLEAAALLVLADVGYPGPEWR